MAADEFLQVKPHKKYSNTIVCGYQWFFMQFQTLPENKKECHIQQNIVNTVRSTIKILAQINVGSMCCTVSAHGN